jgi:hypothetical protein
MWPSLPQTRGRGVPGLKLAVVAALAGIAVAARTPAASAVPAISRRASPVIARYCVHRFSVAGSRRSVSWLLSVWWLVSAPGSPGVRTRIRSGCREGRLALGRRPNGPWIGAAFEAVGQHRGQLYREGQEGASLLVMRSRPPNAVWRRTVPPEQGVLPERSPAPRHAGVRTLADADPSGSGSAAICRKVAATRGRRRGRGVCPMFCSTNHVIANLHTSTLVDAPCESPARPGRG